LVTDYIKKQFVTLNSKNTIQISNDHAGKWWVADVNNWNFAAAAKATQAGTLTNPNLLIFVVYKVKPDLTREGGSIPVTLTFQDALKKSVLLLPVRKQGLIVEI
jgi:Cys-Gly metallodipeptidase DUG1